MRQLQDRFNALSQKTRVIIIGGFFLVSLIIFFNLLLIPRVKRTGDIEEKIEKAKAKLNHVARLSFEYRNLKDKIEKVEKNIKHLPPGFDITTLLTREAESAGIGNKVISVTSNETILGDRHKEITVKLIFDGISTSQLTRYLFKVKNIEGLIDIRRMKTIRQGIGRESRLKVEVDIATLLKL